MTEGDVEVEKHCGIEVASPLKLGKLLLLHCMDIEL